MVADALLGAKIPPTKMRFTLAGDIGLTVEYGSDGLACQMVIEKKRPLLHTEQSLTYTSPEAVDELVDEIVPPSSRGREINSLLESKTRESRATVVFKRPECPISPYAQWHD